MTTVRERWPAAGTAALRRLPRRPFERRSLTLLAAYLLVVLLVAGRLVQVQVVDAEVYAQRGLGQSDQFVTLPADRGRLYDRDGEVLAASVAATSVWADPRAFRSQDGQPPAQDVGEAAAALAPVLDLRPGWVERRLRGDGAFAWLARQVDREVGDEVAALGLEGVGTVPEPRRVNPGGTLAAQLLGLTDLEGSGIAGLELEHDDALTGQPGWLDFESSRDGYAIPTAEREVQAAVPGTDLVLTVDRQVQFTAERVAAEAVEESGAKGASVVVLEVGTGDVLAMASAPLADLGDRDDLDPEALRNRAVTDMLEPGSVQKAITAAAAIEDGVVTPSTRVHTPNQIQVGGSTFSDSHDPFAEHMTFAQVIETSSNVGTIQVAQELGDERLAHWLDRFGYGTPVGVDFPGEAPGSVRDVDQWWGTSLPTIAIGQGVAVTLLQAANAYATIANDGVATTPRLLRGTVGEDGRLVPVEDGEGERVVSATTARQVRQMLASVVDGERGTGTAAAVDGHRVAGKTGTARKPSNGGYSGYVATFVGMAPAEDPELVVAVMVDEPSTAIYGGVVAAPVFAEVMAEGLRRAQVPPTGRLAPAEVATATEDPGAVARGVGR